MSVYGTTTAATTYAAPAMSYAAPQTYAAPAMSYGAAMPAYGAGMSYVPPATGYGGYQASPYYGRKLSDLSHRRQPESFLEHVLRGHWRLKSKDAVVHMSYRTI